MNQFPSPQQLRYLVALSEQRHFGRAANICAVTQSTLSAGILALERQLDTSLVDRSSSKGVIFTPAGEEVIRKARLALDSLRSVYEAAEFSKEKVNGVLRLGVIPTIAPFLLHTLTQNIRKQFPEVQLSINEDLTERLIEKINQGDLDLLVLAMPCHCRGVETYALWRDHFFLAMPEHHALSSIKEIGLEQLTHERMVFLEDGHCLRDQTLDVCRQTRGWHMEVGGSMFAASSLVTQLQMVREGFGLAIIPELACKSGLVKQIDNIIVRPISSPNAWRTIGLAWRPRTPLAESFKALVPIFQI